jgi:hypothetical protein
MFDDQEETSTKSMFPADVYALGIILGQLWTKRAPWKGKTPHKVMAFVLKGKRPPFEGFKDGKHEPQTIPDHLKKLIEECWSQLPEDRPTVENVFHRFENDVIPSIVARRRSILPEFITHMFSPHHADVVAKHATWTSIDSLSAEETITSSSTPVTTTNSSGSAAGQDPKQVGMTVNEGRKIERVSYKDPDMDKRLKESEKTLKLSSAKAAQPAEVLLYLDGPSTEAVEYKYGMSI